MFLAIESMTMSLEEVFMRKEFFDCLYEHMKKDQDIILVVGDLGFGLADKIKDQLPHQFINVGAAEQAGADICVGLALADKKPYFYSITTFLLYRAFETVRTYINHERLNIKLIGSGRDFDYLHDGISHWSVDAFKLFDWIGGEAPIFRNIRPFWPDNKTEISKIVEIMVETKDPCFLSLKR